ncbi:hypothetical protein Q0F98_34630 [Paenibacillus amylolyticus]|nr:hypothetical protein Q0F98_34630 [Paenibacillus amylolyticus]
MAHETEAAGFTGFLPFSFWAAVETSCISQQLRIACQGVFADWQDVIKKHLILDGVGEEKAGDGTSDHFFDGGSTDYQPDESG